MTASAARVRPKKGFWFDVTVSNAGPSATAATLAVQLTGAPNNLSVSDPRCSLQGLQATCSFAELVSGSPVAVRISGTAPNKDTITAAATVDGALADPNAANDSDTATVQVR